MALQRRPRGVRSQEGISAWACAATVLQRQAAAAAVDAAVVAAEAAAADHAAAAVWHLLALSLPIGSWLVQLAVAGKWTVALLAPQANERC